MDNLHLREPGQIWHSEFKEMWAVYRVEQDRGIKLLANYSDSFTPETKVHCRLVDEWAVMDGGVGKWERVK
jgi:hypothetical protein